jgi:hypothetical protein
MVKQERVRRIENESYSAFKKRLVRSYTLPRKLITKSVAEMKMRVNAILKSKGGYTKYDLGGNRRSR